MEINYYINWPLGIHALSLCSQVGLYSEVITNTGLTVKISIEFSVLNLISSHVPTNSQWGVQCSVVECLTRDRGAAGSSLTGVTVLCP